MLYIYQVPDMYPNLLSFKSTFRPLTFTKRPQSIQSTLCLQTNISSSTKTDHTGCLLDDYKKLNKFKTQKDKTISIFHLNCC